MKHTVEKLALWFNGLPSEAQYKFMAHWLAIEAQGITQGKLAAEVANVVSQDARHQIDKSALIKSLYAYDLQKNCFKKVRWRKSGIKLDDLTLICSAINQHRETVCQEKRVSAEQFYNAARRQLGKENSQRTPLTDFSGELTGNSHLDRLARTLAQSKQWTTVPSVLRRSPNVDIRELYVELRILADAGQVLSTHSQREFVVENDFYVKDRAIHFINAESLLTRLSHRSVLVGPPGSGKSTLMRWLYVYLLDNIKQLKLYPVPVQLRKYADQIQDGLNTTLVQFAWNQLAAETADRISQAPLQSSKNVNIIYLLDGWDEVPPSLHNCMRDIINAETSHHCTLITSRQSGIPELLQDGQTIFYEIGPLTDYAIATLCQRYAKQRHAIQRIPELFNILERTPALMLVAKNPYLLTLFCEVYFEHFNLPGYQVYAPHWVMTQASSLMRDDHNFVFTAPNEGHVTKADFEAIQTIAYQLSFGAHEKNTIFSAAHMQLPSGNDFTDSPLLRSRFFNAIKKNKNTLTNNGDFEFSHLRLQEFFAAQYVANTELTSNIDWIANKFLSLAWREEMGFVGGELAHDADNAYWRTLKYWLQNPDLGGEIIRRAADILSVVGVEDGGVSLLNIDVRQLLWEIIKEPERILLEENLSALLRLDVEFMVQKVLEKEIEDTMLAEFVYRKIPLHFRRSLLDEKLRANPIHSWMIGLPARAFPAKNVIEKLVACALNEALPEADRIAALRDLGSGRVIECISPLLHLMDDNNTEIANAAIESLGKIGGRLVAMTMAELLLNTPIRVETVYTLLNALTIQGYGVLEPYSRDFMLAKIDGLNEIDNLKLILNALEGTAISCPPARLLKILENTEENNELRETVASVLHGITEADFISRAINVLKTKCHKKLRNQIISACPYIPVDYDFTWLWEFFLTLDNQEHGKQLLLMLFFRTLRQFGNHPLSYVLIPFMENVLQELIQEEAAPVHKCTLKQLDLLQKRRDERVIHQKLMQLVSKTGLSEEVKALVISAIIPAMLTPQEIERLIHMLPEVIDGEYAALSDALAMALFIARPVLASKIIRLAKSSRKNIGKMLITAILTRANQWGFIVFNDHVIGPNGQKVST